MATYQVQAGDTVDGIAKRFGVARNSVSGYRSNDPNVILPGEMLDIKTPAEIPMATSAVTGKPVPGSISGTNPMTPAPAPQAPAPQPVQQPQAPAQAPAPQVEPLTTTTPEQTAAYLKAQSLIPQEPEIPGGEEENPVFSQYGINTSDISTGFQTNPMSTLSSLVEQVMKATGLPDVKQSIMDISGEIETLANERDDKIREIQDDPWRSASTKATQINALNDKYEQKIANRTNRLTLLQDTYESARQQAQFAATTAVTLYDNERKIQSDQLTKALDRAEKKAEAQAKLQEPLSVAEAKALGVPYGTTAAEAYGITPKDTSEESTGGYKFSSTQLNNGASNAGVDITTFKGLSGDVQNLFINNSDVAQILVDDVASVQDKSMTYAEAKEDINSQNVPQTVKDYFINLLGTPTQESGGGFFDWLGSFL